MSWFNLEGLRLNLDVKFRFVWTKLLMDLCLCKSICLEKGEKFFNLCNMILLLNKGNFSGSAEVFKMFWLTKLN